MSLRSPTLVRGSFDNGWMLGEGEPVIFRDSNPERLTHAYMGSTKGTQWGKQNKTKPGQEVGREKLGMGIGERLKKKEWGNAHIHHVWNSKQWKITNTTAHIHHVWNSKQWKITNTTLKESSFFFFKLLNMGLGKSTVWGNWWLTSYHWAGTKKRPLWFVVLVFCLFLVLLWLINPLSIKLPFLYLLTLKWEAVLKEPYFNDTALVRCVTISFHITRSVLSLKISPRLCKPSW